LIKLFFPLLGGVGVGKEKFGRKSSIIKKRSGRILIREVASCGE